MEGVGTIHQMCHEFVGKLHFKLLRQGAARLSLLLACFSNYNKMALSH